MRVSDLDYDLPERLIAQEPSVRRGESRLMVVDRRSGAIAHRQFGELAALLRAGDLLVFNDTRVLPARLLARRSSGARIDGLFLDEPEPGRWRVMLNRSRRLRAGEVLRLRGDRYALVLEEPLGRGSWTARVLPPAPAEEALAQCGLTPLPPYIQRGAADGSRERLDRERYQTVYAQRAGAIAAPTAGLHFTDAQLRELDDAGIGRAKLTLHVGPGTFLPITVESLDEHPMHAERYELPEATAAVVNQTRRRGGRVIAVGTTSLRVLETRIDEQGEVTAGCGETRLLIRPPQDVRSADGLITNFHLPRSTLLALVFAFASREIILRAYEEAIARDYRFYSYGDAMLIV